MSCFLTWSARDLSIFFSMGKRQQKESTMSTINFDDRCCRSNNELLEAAALYYERLFKQTTTSPEHIDCLLSSLSPA